jgi:hypothetical protein
MKKRSTSFLTAAAALFILLSASSCTREYTCQCKMTSTGQPGLPAPAVREYPITDSKKNAESSCKAKSNTTNSGGITTVEECDLF